MPRFGRLLSSDGLKGGWGVDDDGFVQVCHKCAVRFDPMCANSLRFNTRPNRSRAGLVVGKLLTLKGTKAWKDRSYSPTLNQ
jgi:hypothetical protein